jgi:hypothetical protein
VRLPPGTAERVSGYTKKDGTHVDAYRRSTPDKNLKDNWSTKGNQNLVNAKPGAKVANKVMHG